MLTGWPRDTSMYPRTDLWEDNKANVDSSSGDIPEADVDAWLVPVPVGCEMKEVRAGAATGATPLRD